MSSSRSSQSPLAKIAQYVETLTRDPKSRVFVPLSEIYRQAGLSDDALTVLLKGVRMNPDYALGYAALGRVLVATEKTEEAEKAFRKAIQVDADCLPALKGLLRLLWGRKNREGARKLAERVLALDAGDGDANKILKLTAHAPSASQPTAVRAADSIDEEESAEPPEGEEPIKTATLAEIYVRQGLYQKALKVYQEILGRDPQNQQIRQRALDVKKRLEQQMAQEGPLESGETVSSHPQPVLPRGDACETKSPAPVERPDPTEVILSSLESWLDSIRQRREHVQ